MTSFVLKAVAETLKKHPMFNCSLDEGAGEIVLKEYYPHRNRGGHGGGPDRPGDSRRGQEGSAPPLAQGIEEVATKARERKVSSEELKGGSFTISNQGGIGGGHFTPIINKPEVAILGLGKGAMKAVVRDGEIEPRMMLPLGLSYDHRVIDGAEAARFIVDLVNALEKFA